MRVTNSVTNQFEETGINNCVGRKFKTIAWTPVGQDERPAIGIFVCATMDFTGIDADVVPGYSRDQSPSRRDRPELDIGFKEVRIVSNEFGRCFITAVVEEFGRTYQCGNMDRER